MIWKSVIFEARENPIRKPPLHIHKIIENVCFTGQSIKLTDSYYIFLYKVALKAND